MVKPDKGFLLPEEIDPPRYCVRINVPQDQHHIAAFWGALQKLSNWWEWEKDDEHKGREAAAVWREILNEASTGNTLENCSEECAVDDIRIEGCMLQKRVDGEWVDVGSLLSGLSLDASSLPSGDDATITVDECEIEFGIPRGATGDTGATGPVGPIGETGKTGAVGDQTAYIIPETPDEDVLCKAAWYMANQYADDFQDKVQNIKTAIEFAQTQIKAALEAADNIAFWLQDALVALDILIGDTTLVGIEYLEEQVFDPDALHLAAEQFYCALKNTYDDDFEGFFEEIDYPLEFPMPALEINEIGDWVWTNFEDVVEFVLGVATGASAGWGILAWAHIHNTLMPEFVQPLFISNPYEALIKLVLNNADVFAVANCFDFACQEFCHTFNFNMDGSLDWTALNAPPYGDLGTFTENGVETFDGVQVGTDPAQHFSMFDIRRTISSTFITTIQIYVNVGDGNGNPRDQYNVAVGDAGDPTTDSCTIPVGSSGLSQTINVNRDIENLIVSLYIGKAAPIDSPFGYHSIMTHMVICGMGADPF